MEMAGQQHPFGRRWRVKELSGGQPPTLQLLQLQGPVEGPQESVSSFLSRHLAHGLLGSPKYPNAKYTTPLSWPLPPLIFFLSAHSLEKPKTCAIVPPSGKEENKKMLLITG